MVRTVVLINGNQRRIKEKQKKKRYDHFEGSVLHKSLVAID
jgi:hypothetical protein